MKKDNNLEENFRKSLQTMIIVILGLAITFSLFKHGHYILAVLNIALQYYFYKTAVLENKYILEPIYKYILKIFKK